MKKIAWFLFVIIACVVSAEASNTFEISKIAPMEMEARSEDGGRKHYSGYNVYIKPARLPTETDMTAYASLLFNQKMKEQAELSQKNVVLVTFDFGHLPVNKIIFKVIFTQKEDGTWTRH